MTTIQAFKNTSGYLHEESLNIYHYHCGPVMQLESDSLEQIMSKVLPPLWNKGWEWAIIKSPTFKIKMYCSGICHFEISK